jgi:hypothetical protein
MPNAKDQAAGESGHSYHSELSLQKLGSDNHYKRGRVSNAGLGTPPIGGYCTGKLECPTTSRSLMNSFFCYAALFSIGWIAQISLADPLPLAHGDVHATLVTIHMKDAYAPDILKEVARGITIGKWPINGKHWAS